MPEPTSSIFSLLKLIKPLVDFSGWLFKRAHLFVFKLRKKTWLNQEAALKAAQITLGGSVISAIPFRNFKSPRQYIAALRKDFDESEKSQIFLLEKVGGSYLVIWNTEPLNWFKEETFHVADITGEGHKSISYAQESWGSGLGSRNLLIYSTKENKQFEISETYNYSHSDAPDYYPEIDVGDDERFREKVIDYATTRGFLQEIEPPDFSKPKYSVHRWHKENGDRITGRIKTYRYAGEPDYIKASIADLAEIGNTRWIAVFKGPLIKYNKLEDNHYIVYSPSWVYEWAKSLLGTERTLWFVCHGVPGLFFYDEKSETLSRFCGYNNIPIPAVAEITSNKSLLLQLDYPENAVIEIQDVTKLQSCRPHCCFSEPHLPFECYEERRKDYDLKLNN